MSAVIDRVNALEMSKASSVQHYSRRDDLCLAEQAALGCVAGTAKGRRILDIGVGGGRTVRALREVSPDYLGIDYSQEMIAACQKRYPGVAFRHGDARSMDYVPDGTVHLAMFSCNGIGMVAHADRLRIVQEVHRVLEPGGVFLFRPTTRKARTTTRASSCLNCGCR